jgi:muconolactone delta-isomerase
MTFYMVEMELPEVLDETFTNLIPKQRAVVEKLIFQNKIYSYSLALDRHKLWMIVQANYEEEVYDIIHKLPLSDYMTSNIHDLAFHNTISLKLPAISLN